jgi:hypothetical protein
MEEVESVSTTTFCPGCRVMGGACFLVLRSFFFLRILVTKAGPRFFFPADHTTKQQLLRRPTRIVEICRIVRSEVSTAVTMNNGIFWDVSPCGS